MKYLITARYMLGASGFQPVGASGIQPYQAPGLPVQGLKISASGLPVEGYRGAD